MSLEILIFIVDESNKPVIIVDQQLYTVCFNKAAEAIFQYQSIEVLGKPLNILIPLGFHISHNLFAKQYMADNEPPRPMNKRKNIIYAKRKDGYEFVVRVAISNWHEDGQQYAIAIINKEEGIVTT
ncbi:PAS domain S-box protein [Zooshikella marina]|uniref:PAS domain S-box protein n=1 Tax=Zooshikella ganghwensis TaxID=202772 RepID=UPI001BAFA651|nr:PAS domain S-box protein [Zooshikella ganghwensis]MBU2705985.1 PAS domain S-box protein [Zooshikella ganghwensis]